MLGQLVSDRQGTNHDLCNMQLQVRKAFVDTVGEWLVSLHERIEHQPRLLPYLLGGLCDDIESVRDVSWCWLEQAGRLHEEDHAADLKASQIYILLPARCEASYV